MGVLRIADVREKIAALDSDLHALLSGRRTDESVPKIPARDLPVLPVRGHPPKPPLFQRQGQARLLHDLASIELQAMELGLRTLSEFSEAPAAFRAELAEITRGEGRHLAMCLDGLESLGHGWGDWPVHTALWECTSGEDSLLDRILIVHRYLEGSGLDAGDSILRRLSGIESKVVRGAVNVIVSEEIGHVRFGSEWYRRICRDGRIDPSEDFPVRMEALLGRIPKRMEAISRSLREAAGFDAAEIEYLEDLRRRRLARTGHLPS